jgi:hypothetical protein
MRRNFLPISLLLAGFCATGAVAQLPRIVVLPDNDFVWEWGRTTRLDDRDRPDFTVVGREERFSCTLNGSFRPNSRYNDQFVIRDMEANLISTPYFIQASTELMNNLDRARDIQWASLDCKIPEATTEQEAELRERENEALERARRAQEKRRREREE